MTARDHEGVNNGKPLPKIPPEVLASVQARIEQLITILYQPEELFDALDEALFLFMQETDKGQLPIKGFDRYCAVRDLRDAICKPICQYKN
jgi:hypothetical protein